MNTTVDMACNDGSTAIHIAAEEGHLPVVRFLVNSGGADENAVNHQGITALHVAARENRTSVTKFLVRKGADQGASASHAAVRGTALEASQSGGATEAAAYLERKRCAVCGVRGYTKRCARCGAVEYCSTECQKAHWREHKPECVARQQPS